MNHSYIIDLSKDTPPETYKGARLGYNAPTFICLTSPYHSPKGMETHNIPKDDRLSAEKEKELLAAQEKKRIEKEEKAKVKERAAEEARAGHKEEVARNKELRAAISARRQAEDRERKRLAATELREVKSRRMKALNASRAEKKRLALLAASTLARATSKPPAEPIPPGYISQNRAAIEAHVSGTTVSKYVKLGSIPCIKRGRNSYVRAEDVRAEYARRMAAIHEYNKGLGRRRSEAAERRRACQEWDDKHILSIPDKEA